MAQSPTPDERIESLQGWLDKRPLFEILREGLALNKGQDNDIPEIARPLMQHLKLICIDTESYTDNTDELTELGIVQLKYSQADSTRNPGEHGLLLLKQMAFLQFCVVENAHLVSGPKENHYGHPRWTTFGELGMILHGIINKRITTNKELEGCVEPVVLLGHDLKHDIRHLQKSALQYDISSQRSIVATVDTQVLAKEVGLYHPSAKTAKEQATLQIGLLDLAQAIGFEHKLLHTACYDAASTIICAIHIALPKDLSNPGNANLTLQGVVDQVKVASTQKTPPFGTVHCCARCSNRSHSKSDCTEIVSCDACKKFDTHQTSHTDEHCEMYCIHIAAFKAGMRRVFIAAEKKKKVNETFSTELKSKGTSAHPFSSWPKPSWPSEDPTQVMADFDRFPPTFKVLNLHNVTNYGPLPAKGDWKLKDGTIRRDRTRSYATIATSSSGGRPQQGAVLAMRGRGQPSTPSSGQGTPHSGSTDRSAPGGRSGGGSWRDSNWRRK